MKQEHNVKFIGVHMLDQYECSCGWKSNPYFDGDHWAYKEWLDHVDQKREEEKEK